MAEYWKSTPSYWCKFCSIYVRDTGIERKNHEASAKHQNNIQRSLRQLHQNKAREDRDKQRARDEVARLNALVDGKGKASEKGDTKILGLTDVSSKRNTGGESQAHTAAQRKAHAEQLAALGVKLPKELEKEVTGIGGWQTVSERIIEGNQNEGRSLADIVKSEGESKEAVADALDSRFKGVHKRKAEDEDEITSKRKIWGSSVKTYPGSIGEAEDKNLGALLNGVNKRPEPKREDAEDGTPVKKEEPDGVDGAPAPVGDGGAPRSQIKGEDAEAPATSIVFKKRKFKR